MRGQTYWALKNLPAAEGQLQQVVAMDSPWRAGGLLDLARIRALLGRKDEAAKALKQCLELGNTPVAAEAAASEDVAVAEESTQDAPPPTTGGKEEDDEAQKAAPDTTTTADSGDTKAETETEVKAETAAKEEVAK